ncbi:helix-turn-helix domain-containing protein [Desulfovibrio sp.]|jgi:transcriptional regulator with XRE-family HTH domain|uniref:helix-turn-helix domain-containing protein n=1 Tax=Desulfovibrio sp. TaxID=885 RepID=UPI002A762278|nr:helix-turn-helix transcriptional regulator [Desulfovibrio sp.]MDY2665804.1 helix-turn-helix transcriptional regulator [Desulfovibrio sp.]
MNTITDPKYRIFINCLKLYREQAGLTQQELAEKLCCSQSYISKYEQYQKRLDILEVRRICIALGVSLQECILDFEEKLILGGIHNG